MHNYCPICERSVERDAMSYVDAPCIELEALICDECAAIITGAIRAITKARTDGNHYPVDFWRTDPRDNIDHAVVHLEKCRQGDTTEDHISHALCTLALEYAK